MIIRSVAEEIIEKIWGLDQNGIEKIFQNSYDKDRNELFIDGKYYFLKFNHGRVVDVSDL